MKKSIKILLIGFAVTLFAFNFTLKGDGLTISLETQNASADGRCYFNYGDYDCYCDVVSTPCAAICLSPGLSCAEFHE